MSPVQDHPLRYTLSNELHARPFPTLTPPCFAAHLAIKQPRDAAARDRSLDRAHLLELLDRFGAQHPEPEATHYFGKIGRYELKWEQHTEFVTYTIFGPGVADRPFDPSQFSVFPDDWLARAPGTRVTSVLIRVEPIPDENAMMEKLKSWLVPESMAVSRVLDASAVIASDFRIDPAGHMRMAVFTAPGTGARRVGRIVQRLCEIETYKAMSMLGLARARVLSGNLGQLDRELGALTTEMTAEVSQPDVTLKALLETSAELETLLAQSSFRFGATTAYEALVNQRIAVLREANLGGRQTLAEFMMRRFDPSMRTVKATEKRLHEMSDRAIRAGNLLRTRVDVERSAQNQELLESMDRRADLQLRLQHTVEGLSVVAISYYAVSLASYLAYPALGPLGLSKGMGTAILTPVVVLLVWAMVRRIRKSVE
ncbi:DUF3422 family protein [Profundibacterium mesophilum]|uniref:Membrane-anchored protein n=1 Tax=Profundibacterium mesophilum KAUST100406-0324 TaxID=1037889 RepID=A0A921NU67_9RHOB|nr:DUF3422 domain-containing protein [Profundibacterium mesophilum]KAF0675633.1 putative membrane-anchored protein [Profundibacterium mesophilum KAUST100406-0324]